jgi:hypothetical protein
MSEESRIALKTSGGKISQQNSQITPISKGNAAQGITEDKKPTSNAGHMKKSKTGQEAY